MDEFTKYISDILSSGKLVDDQIVIDIDILDFNIPNEIETSLQRKIEITKSKNK